jgi:TolA-binding protein
MARKYRTAATYFQRFIDGEEKDRNTVNDAITRIGDSYFVLKSYEKALDYYNRIIQITTLKAKITRLFQRGMIQGLQGSPDTQDCNTLKALLFQFP